MDNGIRFEKPKVKNNIDNIKQMMDILHAEYRDIQLLKQDVSKIIELLSQNKTYINTSNLNKDTKPINIWNNM